MQADIFVLGTPIWLGQPSSVAKRALERMDAFLSEADDKGRMPVINKVALVAVVGNEDGAHHCHAACFQALADVGFTIPPNAGIYWVGEAMGSTNYVDLGHIPEKVSETIELAVANAVHLADRLVDAAEVAVGVAGDPDPAVVELGVVALVAVSGDGEHDDRAARQQQREGRGERAPSTA